MAGSTGNQYSVELTDKGFECDCIGFGWHGYCKHSKKVLKQVEVAMARSRLRSILRLVLVSNISMIQAVIFPALSTPRRLLLTKRHRDWQI